MGFIGEIFSKLWFPCYYRKYIVGLVESIWSLLDLVRDNLEF